MWLLLSLLIFNTSFSNNSEWKRQPSKHFEIIYHAEQRQLAMDYLRLAEDIHAELTQVFSQAPKKTYLVLQDESDLSNGAATVFPEPTIYLYPNPPESKDSIYNHSSWSYLLLKHEYIHILNMYPSNGIAGILQSIFGSWARPNLFLPNWYKEGLATEFESRGERFGRLNSELVLGWLRASVLSGNWQKENIGRINSFAVPEYPFGQRPYYFGAFFWQFLIDSYGVEISEKLNQAYSRRLPWLLESTLTKTTGKTYEGLFFEMQDYWQKKILAERQTKQTKGKSLDLEGYDQSDLKRQDDRAIYISKKDNGLSCLRYIKFKNATSWEVEEKKNIDCSRKMTRPFWHKEKIYFDKAKFFERDYLFSDIYSYDIASEETSRITNGKRARFVVVSANDNLYYLITKDGKQHLFDHNNNLTLYSTENSASLHSLTNINSRLYFIHKKTNGNHKIVSFDTKNNSLFTAFETNDNLYSLRKCKTGLCISLAKNKYANIYFLSLKTRNLYQISHSPTFVYDGFEYNGRLIYSEMTAAGLNYKSAKVKQRRVEHEFQQNKNNISFANIKEPVSNEQSYASTRHLLPKYWFPFISYDANGTYYQLTTGSSDPRSIQSYNLTLSYYTANKKWDKLFLYRNQYWSTTWYAIASRDNDYIEAIDRSIQNNIVKLGFENYIYGLSNSWNWNLEFETLKAGFTNSTFAEAGGVSIYIKYADIEPQVAGEPLPRKGHLAKIGHSHYIAEGDWVAFDVSKFTYKNYFSYLLPKAHTMTTHLLGRYSARENRAISLGVENIGGPFYSGDGFSLKGYPAANFAAFSAANLRLQYTMPIYNIYRGERTLPYFFKQFHVNFIYEGLMLDGFYYDKEFKLKSERHKNVFSSFGIELKLTTELFYLAPVNFVLGTYFGDKDFAGGSQYTILNLEVPNFF